MACSNAVMLRYKITMKDGECSGVKLAAISPTLPVSPAIITGITKVNGLDLGEEGTIEVPDWETKATISDGKRTLPQLEIQFRVDADLNNFKAFAAMYNNRANLTVDIDVAVTKRDWTPLYVYRYIDCQLRKFTQEGLELGATKLGLIDTIWSPYDVQLWNCDATDVLVRKTNLDTLPTCVS